MLDLDHTEAVVAILVGGVTLLTALTTWFKWTRPWLRGLRRDFVAGRDALVGRDAVVDSITGKELAPALPGIGQRMANVETAIVAIAHQQAQLDRIEATVATVVTDVDELKRARVERIAAHVETAAAYRVMEAAHNAEPDEFTD